MIHERLTRLLIALALLVCSPSVHAAGDGDQAAAARSQEAGEDTGLHLVGRAVDVEGQPLSDRLLYACPIAHLSEGQRCTMEASCSTWFADMLNSDPLIRKKAEPLLGWGRNWATTDAEGRFDIGGLKAELHRIFVIPRSDRLNNYELTPAPVAAGQVDLDLAPQGQFALLRITGKDGALWPTGQVEAFYETVEWNVPRIELSLRSADKRARLVEAGPGRLLFEVEEGKDYSLPSYDEPATQAARWIMPTGALTVVDLTFPVVAPAGDLRVQVLNPDGRLYRGDNHVRVYSERGDLVMHSWRHHAGPELRTSLLPGRYRIEIDGGQSVPSCLVGFKPILTRYGPAQATCTVRVGEETRVVVSLTRAGRVELTAHLPASVRIAAIEQLVLYSDRVSSCNDAWDLLELGAGGPTLAGTATPSKGGEPIPLRFKVPTCMLTYTSERLIQELATITDTLLPPGEYLIQLDSERFTSEPTLVEVRDGEITELGVQLQLAR